ncbi:hypothetical protein [Bacillus sp. FJAT-44742]|uniref:hypothetical protein n=1 Tax=Bacillus sp. FJAT-44742 TaxID=2014005 RepID=UPI000C2421DA|nr:hypothetical protein [Bacillus sp. FJAT-44742]
MARMTRTKKLEEKKKVDTKERIAQGSVYSFFLMIALLISLILSFFFHFERIEAALVYLFLLTLVLTFGLTTASAVLKRYISRLQLWILITSTGLLAICSYVIYIFRFA